MRRVDVDFVECARKCYRVEAELTAPRSEVWQAIADPTCWSAWFPGVEKAWYRGDPPYGIGTIREAVVHGRRFEEEMRVWEEGRRWGYCITGASVPLAEAQFECHELEDRGGGTGVRWILASDPRLLMRASAPVLPGVLERLHRQAMRNLDAWLRERRGA